MKLILMFYCWFQSNINNALKIKDMTTDMDKGSVRRLIVSLLKGDEELCTEVFIEIINHNLELLKHQEVLRILTFEKIIQDNFKEYEAVFKALAKH